MARAAAAAACVVVAEEEAVVKVGCSQVVVSGVMRVAVAPRAQEVMAAEAVVATETTVTAVAVWAVVHGH